MSDAPEVLALDARSPWPWRRVLVVVAVLVLVGGLAAVLDRRVREEEAAAVAACRAQGAEAMAAASRPLWSMTNHVRPALSMTRGRVRRDLYTIVSDAASGAEDRLGAALDGCRDVSVLWLHPGLQQRRDACVAALEAQRTWYGEVVRDGRRGFGSPAGQPGDCG